MMRWERFEQVGLETSNGPGKRWGHTCNTIKGGRFVYVFGGYGRDNCQTNQVHVFDTVKQSWSQPLINGTPPTPRDSHTCTAVGDNLFVFGGTDGMNPLNDLHILDTSTHTWVCPSVRGDGPEAREGHSAALDGKRLFIFGGCGKSTETNDEEYYNDLYILNTETFVWKHATTSGTPPSARDSHTFSSWKNKLIVIGGEDGHDYYLSDVHILDAETLTWKELRTSGQKMPPRAGHSTVALGRNLFVFGGFTDAQNLYDDLYMLDVDSGLWTKVMTHGQGPSARFSVAGDILDPMKGGVLMFIGGCNKSLEALDDMYYLHTGLASIGDERRVEKLSLRKQLKLKCQEQNLNIPMHDKALVRIDTTADFTHTIPPSYAQPSRENFVVNEPQFLQGKKVFHAKLSESFPHGYSIETIIDGKLLRGILFSNNPSQNNSRKRSGREAGVLNGEHDDKPKSPKSVKQDTDSVLPDHAQGKELTSHELQIEFGVVPTESNLNSSNASQSQEIPANVNTSLPLNLNDDTAADAQTPEAAKFDAEMRTENAPSDGQTHTAEVCNDPWKSN